MYDFKEMKYDNIDFIVYFDTDYGNKGDGYETPAEKDYFYIVGIFIMNEDGQEIELTEYLKQSVFDELEYNLNH